jgi:hypothetical protein
MKRLKTGLAIFPVAALIIVAIHPITGHVAGVQQRSRTAAATPSWPCSIGIPTISSAIPNDAILTNQPTLNCFAWQEFIALNWAASPTQRGVADPKATPAQFGTPSALAPKVWETYKANSEVFLPGGATPKGWNDPPPPPSCSTGSAAAMAQLRKPGTRVLSMSSAFGDFNLNETNQASGQWLADQNGNLIWYEIKLNLDEFNTIVKSQFYNATVQLTAASTGKNPISGGQYQVQLPSGCLSGSCPHNGQPMAGAIELKSAWRILPDSSLNGRDLTSQAVLVGANGSCSTATVGLVGLHIIHKTITQPQFIWATFEQVDNVPPASPATFSSSSCQCQTVIPSACMIPPPKSALFQNCITKQQQGQTCTPNTPPPYNTVTAGCKAYPIQVSRSRPISNNSSDPVVATNTAAQQLITTSNPHSVFQYYQLVDVLWSGSAVDSYTNPPGQPGPTVPLSMSGATPDPVALPVANTTMETYVQSNTCLSCHVYANAAGSKGSMAYASDFSFLLGDAQSPSSLSRAQLSRAVRPSRTLPKGLVKLRH